MTEPPKRFLEVTELSVEQLIRREQARKRGEPEPRFESPEYLAAREQLLRERGYEDDAEHPTDEPTDLESLSIDDHLSAIRKAR